MVYKHIAVAVTGEPGDRLLLKKAAGIAGKNNSSVTLVHIDENSTDLAAGVYMPSTSEVIGTAHQSSQHKLMELIRDTDLPDIKLRIEKGRLPESLAELIRQENCDLLICGHHHSFLNRLLPVYRGLVNGLAADLLIVPLAGDEQGTGSPATS